MACSRRALVFFLEKGERKKKAAEMVGADRKVLISRTRTEIEGADVVSTNLYGVLRLLQGKNRNRS